MVADTANIVTESWYNVRKGYGVLGIWMVCLLVGCGGAAEQIVQVSEPIQNSEQSVMGAEVTAVPKPEPTEVSTTGPEPTGSPVPGEYDFTVCFAGDISLAEGAVTTQKMDSSEEGIFDCISPELLEYMDQADIFCVNNEFAYSIRGEPLAGKAYTFRANPERVDVLGQMGVDVVSLANNHVYDYGGEALLDTLSTLQDAEISYFGAGANLEEAMQPIYKEVDGKKIAFVGASRAEKNKMTPQAGEDTPGILRCYDTQLFQQVIEEADANADFVLAYVHWGTEYSHELEDVQLQTGKEYLDAGADVIIGAHSHCLQGMEYYDGKPIIYSLGNYWFNKRTLDTMLLQLRFWGNDAEEHLEVRVIPAIQEEQQTRIVEDEKERERIFSFLEEISVNVAIDGEGIVSLQ